MLVDVAFAVLVGLVAPQPTPWAQATSASAGPARSVGTYNRGCIGGARALALKGPGWRVMKPERVRYFGHPVLLDVVHTLAGFVKSKRLGALRVGDLGQPRGGPAPSGHASHQTGLDVDIGYALAPPAEGEYWRSMVEGPRGRVTPDFGASQLKLVRQAALDERVDRIFVNPVIKRTLCARAPKPEAERAWLRKVRPWWGHDEHMHVRLRCQSGSPECDDQAALPEGDGCDRLGWWFAKRKRQPEPLPKPDPAPEPKPKPARPLPPPECDAVLAAPPQSGP